MIDRNLNQDNENRPEKQGGYGGDSGDCQGIQQGESIRSIGASDTVTNPPTRPGWWFLCPICGRRCGKLHLGSEGVEFACRICGGLTYRSCQESSRLNDRIAEQVASSEGMDEKYVRKLLRMAPEQAKLKGRRWARDRDRVGWSLEGVLCGWLAKI
jgi:hypothetical protein